MGSQGIYNRRFDRVFFDLNGDDKPSSLETYKVWEKYVNMGETTYEFEVQRYGQSLTLRPTAMHLPARQSLEQGSLMPDFSIKDISGVVHRSSDFRGNVLLLDFWGTWCAPCVAEAPTLSAIYKRFHERGLEIFGIHNGLDTDSVKAFIAKYDMHWTHALETEDGTLHRMFRIQGWPTYYLIGSDGTILTGDLRPGDKLIGEIETLLKQK